MADGKRRPWTEEDNAKLRSLAGTMKAHAVARDLGRTVGATIMQATKLKISMSRRQYRLLHNRQAAPSLDDRKQGTNPIQSTDA
jgi:hypothetical protein